MKATAIEAISKFDADDKTAKGKEWYLNYEYLIELSFSVWNLIVFMIFE